MQEILLVPTLAHMLRLEALTTDSQFAEYITICYVVSVEACYNSWSVLVTGFAHKQSVFYIGQSDIGVGQETDFGTN